MSRPKILAIDDQQDILISLKGLLKNLLPDIEVLSTTSGSEGISIAKKELLDLILVDLNMPEMDGLEVCRILKSHESTRIVPIVVVTGMPGHSSNRTLALEAGADAFLTKPFAKAELVAQIKAMIRLKKAEDTLRNEKNLLEGKVKEQTQVLHRELEERRKTEERVKTINALFLRMGKDFKGNLGLLTQAAGEMLGGACAFYNRLFDGKLCSWGMWRPPEGYSSTDRPDGHICYDIIRQGTKDVVVFQNLLQSTYAGIDPNVRDYGWKTFIGKAVQGKDESVGSLCVVFLDDHQPSEGDLTVLGILASAIEQEEGRRQAEMALRESEARFSTIFRLSPVGISIHSGPDARAVDINTSLLNMLDCSPEEVLGRTPLELGLWKDVEEQNHMNQLLREKGKIQNCRVDLRKQTGEIAHLLLNLEVIEINVKPFILCMVVDFTDQKRAEEKLQQLQEKLIQAQKMESIGRLAGGIAHDLNNLLTPILGYVEILLEKPLFDTPTKDSLETILSAGKGAKAIVHQLLAFARKQALEVKPVQINQVLLDFENLLKRTLREDIKMEFSLSSSLPLIMADVGQIQQVIMNLAVNAQDAMPHGGRLFFETMAMEFDETFAVEHPGMKPGRHLMLALSDTGEGIRADDLSKIFEPFYTTKEKGKGTGLGLAMVLGIINQHGGHMSVCSEPGKGTMFKMYFPVLHSGTYVTETVKDISKPLRGKEFVLIAEDDDKVRMLISDVLPPLGYSIFAVADLHEATQFLLTHEGSLHLLLADVIMPDGNGKELFALVSQRFPDVKVIFMSGYTDNVIAHHGVLDRGINFIQKPFTVQGLIAKVREVLDE
jgi:PAS domain S-box-containing protein